ncbi:HNH endonuclease [Chryseobacterium sp. MEBOG07]|uniref:HNH endonuclease n=1 Tax=Chryseobacterium sp. MEBOG07 TaxID=2879939 RepID=UPI001F189A74|nr:HNH endonuclease [Chryseobacterium sp. MEBOG07]UKB80963.1 HNH endonuclease [Chryseobacterium sp. MEBOG07]
MSRHIPKPISDKVFQMHFFECAWCCEKLTERHHIEEYSKGGKHEVDNLILLCPNCHTQVHKNEISESDLLKRKSTHLKGDRLSGGIQFDINTLRVKLGNNFFENVPILIMINKENILGLQKVNNNILLNCRFYNEQGYLIFWMSANRYWAQSDFIIRSKKMK